MLMSDNAARAKKIVENAAPLFESKEAFFAYVDNLSASGDRITYLDDGTANIKID